MGTPHTPAGVPLHSLILTLLFGKEREDMGTPHTPAGVPLPALILTLLFGKEREDMGTPHIPAGEIPARPLHQWLEVGQTFR
jgi:hypothetical protein